MILLHLDSQFNKPKLSLDDVSTRQGHFDKLFRACHEIAQLPEDALDITVDFDRCKFIGHNGVAFLGGLVHLIQARGGCVTFNWDSLRSNIRMNLDQNGFLKQFGCGTGPWEGNSIPFRSDLRHDTIAIGDYLRDQWLGRGWVSISPGLKDAITGKVSEIYLNAFEHGHSEIGVFSCGQHYPQMGMLHLTVIDFGIGIPTSVRALPENAPLTTAEALSWALQSGTTTKKQNGISRGLGLNPHFSPVSERG